VGRLSTRSFRVLFFATLFFSGCNPMDSASTVDSHFYAGIDTAPTAIASSLVFRTAPSSTGDIETNLAVQPVIAALDSSGETVTAYSRTISFTGYSDAACTTPVASAFGTGSSVAAVAGIATFSALRIEKTAVIAVQASDGAVSTNCLTGFTIAPGSVNLVVPIEVLHFPIASSTAVTDWSSAAVILNPVDFDGQTVQYFFEVVAGNVHLSQDYTVNLMSAGSTIASIPVPANTVTPTRIRIAFATPGASATYFIRLPATAAASDVRLYSARILVKQTRATKTRIYYPLVGGAAATAPATATDHFLWGETNQVFISNATFARLFRKNESAYADIPTAGSPWRMEVSVQTTAGSRPCLTRLYNRTSGLPVTGANTSSNGAAVQAAPVHTSVNFQNNAVEFDDGDLFELRISTSNGSVHACKISNANLSVRLTNLSKAEIPYRLSYAQSIVGAGSATQLRSRQSISTADFSYAKYFYEIIGSSTVADNGNVAAAQASVAEDGSAGTTISGAAVVAPTPRGVARSAELNASSIEHLSTGLTNSSGTQVHTGSHLVIKVSNQ
jgi:hypothetical protein